MLSTITAIAIIGVGGFLAVKAYGFLRSRLQHRGYRHPSILAIVCVLVAIDIPAGWAISLRRSETDPPPSLSVVALLAICLVGTIVCYVYVTVRSYRLLRDTLRRKGRKSPAVFETANLISWTLTLGGWVVAARYLHEPLPAAAAAVIAAPLACAFMASRLRLQDPRAEGPRVVRFPYRRVGYGLIGLAAAAPLVAILAGSGRMAIQAAFLLLSGGFASLAIGRRALAPTAPALLANDPRPPVLYLRPFSLEEDNFAQTPVRGADFIPFRRLTQGSTRTLEQYLGDEIRCSIGPFIALGNPTDFVAPDGAARFYFSDDHWMEEFREIAWRAALIVVVVGVSDHLLWELRHLKEAGLGGKLFVLTKPWLGTGSASRRGRPGRGFTRQSHDAWIAFASALRMAGYQPTDEDPGPGSVVAFDRDGRTVPLCSNAKSPADLVRAIRKRMGVMATGPSVRTGTSQLADEIG